MGVTTEKDGSNQQDQQQGQQQQSEVQHTPDFLKVVHGKIHELEATMGASNNSAEKESAKHRKRVLKEMERFLENKAHTPEDKVTFLQTKYTQMVTDLYRVEKHFHEAQTKLDSTIREKDKVQLELRKSNAVRDKLEELCRQLQNDNRNTLEVARKLREEDAALRQAMQNKFSASISDIGVKMEEQNAERLKQAEDNEALHNKLTEVMGNLDAFNKLVHTKDLEVQLADAKLKQQEAINEQLTKKNELYMQSHEQLEKTHQSIAAELEAMVVTKQENVVLKETNNTLRNQLSEYAKQFSSVQSSIAKSNKVFDQYKKDMEMSSKQRVLLLKDCEAWKAKASSSESQVQQLQSKLALSEVDPDEVKRLRTQKEALEGLCRSLQAQVKAGKVGVTEGGELNPPASMPQGNEA